MDVVVIDRSGMMSEALCEALRRFGLAARPSQPHSLEPGKITAAVVRLTTEADLATLESLAAAPGVTVTVLVEDPTTAAVVRSLRAGARHVVAASDPVEALVVAITYPGTDGSIIPQSCAASLASQAALQEDDTSPTDEECRWLRDLAAGSRVHEVAARAGYSEREMFRRLDRLYRSLGARNRVEALLVAQRLGLLAVASGD